MSLNQYYANGVLSSMSTKLFGADKFSRIAECFTIAEALKILQENGYGNGIVVKNPNNYEDVFRAELDCLMGLFKEMSSDSNCTRYFLCPYDYVNAKLLMKSKYMRVDGTASCFANASFNVQQMQECVVKDDYSMFSKIMAEACDQIDAQFASGNRSPQVVDTILDVAMFKDLRHFANRCTLPLVKDLFVWHVDTLNLMLVFRMHKAGFSKEQFLQLVVDGGSIGKAKLANLWDGVPASDGVLPELWEGKRVVLEQQYLEFFNLCKADSTLQRAEKAQHKHRYNIITQNVNMLSVHVLVDYFFRKLEEIDKLRYTLVSIKNGVDKEQVKDVLKQW